MPIAILASLGGVSSRRTPANGAGLSSAFHAARPKLAFSNADTQSGGAARIRAGIEGKSYFAQWNKDLEFGSHAGVKLYRGKSRFWAALVLLLRTDV